MNDIAAIEERQKKLEALEQKVDKEAAKEEKIYKNQPKYIKDVKKDIEEQKKIAEKEKEIVNEHKALTEKNKEVQEKIEQKKKELEEARASHEQLKREMNKFHPGSYDPKNNTIDSSKWSEMQEEAYNASREKRENLNKELKEEKKKLAEGQEKQEELKGEYDQLVGAEKKPGDDKPVKQPCVPCQASKVTKQDPQKHWIKFSVKDKNGAAYSDVRFSLELPDGNIASLKPKAGDVELKNIEPGACKVHLILSPKHNLKNVVAYIK